MAAFLALEGRAYAQACCVAPSATGLGRLAMHESALAGIEARGTGGYGSFDAGGRFVGAPGGTHDVGLEQDLFASMRFLSRAQGTIAVPFVETFRGASGGSSSGGGLGDVRGSVRWDPIEADEATLAPGLAVLAGIIAPTGTPPERAADALGAGATGTGTTQGWGGLAIEEISGPWLAALNGIVTLRADRNVGGTRSSLPPRFSTGLVGAHAWTSGFVLSAAASWAYEADASLDGKTVPGTSRRSLQLALGGQIPLGRGARLVASAFATPPIPAISAGDSATAGLSIATIVPWL